MTITTKQYAEGLNIKPESIIRRLSIHKHYFGITPQKLPNRRLAWPADSLDQLKGRKNGC
jgi:hypothetical protein